MRGFIVASLALAGLASAHSTNGSPRRRKTMAFGYAPPTKESFSSVPSASDFLMPIAVTQGDAKRPSVDAMAVARDLLAKVVIPATIEGIDYYVRDDSYTDPNTGVTHLYVRQLIRGSEVANGDIQLNVYNGEIISYSDSFFKGEYGDVDQSAGVHSSYCASLAEQLETAVVATPQDQVPIGVTHSEKPVDKELLEHLYESNCAHVDTPNPRSLVPRVDAFLPIEAIIQFMIASTPDTSLSSDLYYNYDKYVDMMEVTTTHSLRGASGPSYVVDKVPDAVSPVKADLAYIQIPGMKGPELQLVWKLEVEMQDNWYEAAVSAFPPHRIVSVVDWASDSPMPAPEAQKPKSHPAAIYNVHAWGLNDPDEGGRSIQKENFDISASPVGWHALPAKNSPDSEYFTAVDGWINTTTTWGNNVFAHEDWEGRNNWIDNYRPDAGKDLSFDFAYEPKKTNNSADALKEAKSYINATVAQLFYTSNLFHDMFYRYGFDEISGNFQQHNFGRGGRENDAVIANAQDGSGYNNANFMTPPDGQNGRCRMYLWNTANPYRDGDMEAGIVIHELAHGLSTRLTGGPANSGCLGYGEPGGMGEGWGDFFATMIRSTANYSDYPMGAWAANTPKGIRNYVYSTNFTTNPSTYETLDKPGYWGVHAIGEVWAETLYIVAQKFIEKYGFSDTLYPPKPLENGTIPEGDFYRPAQYNVYGERKPLIPKHGNSLIVQLVVSGLKLQKCRPSFFNARDAIIQADQILTGGENLCLLWEGFSAKGLGPDAAVVGQTPWGGGVRTNDFKKPVVCK